jgi:hypothetical protein
MRRSFLLGAFLATAVSLSGVTSAAHAARPALDEATVIGHVRIDKHNPAIGYVRARYTCQPHIDHLWVSVKQNADATVDPALTEEGSGFGHGAAAWVQAHPQTLRCDGRNHVDVFQVDTTEPAPPEFGGGTIGYGALQRGYGYVQFCLTSSADEELLIADQNFQKVK